MRNTRATALLSSLLATLSAFAQPAPQPPSQPCPAVRDVLVTNGRFTRWTPATRVVESVRIVGDRFAEVGTTRLGDVALHAHDRPRRPHRRAGPHRQPQPHRAARPAPRPRHAARVRGFDRRRARRCSRRAPPTLPSGEWITSIGGFDINQFVPPPGAPRFPTLAELDSVTPNHPVFIQHVVRRPVA